jgi:hypothetical protein
MPRPGAPHSSPGLENDKMPRARRDVLAAAFTRLQTRSGAAVQLPPQGLRSGTAGKPVGQTDCVEFATAAAV